MINCRNCINWVDESLAQIEEARAHDPNQPHVFMGCRIFGFIQKTELETCAKYTESSNLFTMCSSCNVPVPKVCISMGECVNCTNTDLFCVDQCIGGDSRKFCTHFVRLHTRGIQLIKDNEVFDLFPAVRMPGQGAAPAAENQNDDAPEQDPSR
jgi:hypothetical protein